MATTKRFIEQLSELLDADGKAENFNPHWQPIPSWPWTNRRMGELFSIYMGVEEGVTDVTDPDPNAAAASSATHTGFPFRAHPQRQPRQHGIHHVIDERQARRYWRRSMDSSRPSTSVSRTSWTNGQGE